MVPMPPAKPLAPEPATAILPPAPSAATPASSVLAAAAAAPPAIAVMPAPLAAACASRGASAASVSGPTAARVFCRTEASPRIWTVTVVPRLTSARLRPCAIVRGRHHLVDYD